MTERQGQGRRPVLLAGVDNHELILASLAGLASEHPSELVVTALVLRVEDLDLRGPAPDVVVLDLYLGRDDTVSTASIPDLVAWGAAVLVHTSAELPVPLRRAVRAGASGLALKNDGTPGLRQAILDVADGEFACTSALAHALLHDPDRVVDLTDRELDILRGIDDGLTQQQVGKRHGIVTETVRSHLKSVREKYVVSGREVTNAMSLVREARREGWLGDG